MVHFNHASSSAGDSLLMNRVIEGLPNSILEKAKVERTPATLQIHATGKEIELDVRIQAVSLNHKGKLLLNVETTRVLNSSLKYSELHLRNFKAFQGNEIVLCSSRWRIALFQHGEFGGLSGHRAVITKTNGEEYEVKELEEVLTILKLFLTFLACDYQVPTVVIGYDSLNRIVCGQIGKFRVKAPPANWFDRTGKISSNWGHLFPAFWSQWKKHPHEIAIMIDYYVSSATMARCGLVKDAVAKSYEALEFLAGLVLNHPDPDDYAKNIAKALEKYDIPHRKLRKSKNPQTKQIMQDLGISGSGYQLINSVRNYITHPMEKGDPQTAKKMYRNYFDSDYARYYYVFDLSQFYFEYLFLKAYCDYTPPLESLHRLLAEISERLYV